LHPPAVLISGREHSGTTLVTTMLGRCPGCLTFTFQGTFFDHRRRLERIGDRAERARWVVRSLRLADEEIAGRAEASVTDADLARRAEEHLVQWAADHPDADPLALYRESMRYLLDETGRQFWAQKATAYVFSIEEILADLPEARFLYMVRNPFDVCASKKRRNPKEERIVGWSLGWIRGLDLARRCLNAFPNRVMILRYEDLVEDPQRAAQDLCNFLGIPFAPEMLDVPHINPAENKYRTIEGSSGINRSRVHYYPTVLTRTEIAAVDVMVGRGLLREVYAELPHLESRPSPAHRLAATGLIATGAVRYLLGRVRWARQKDVPVTEYLGRRIGALRGRT
jgi:hypothetical protein